MSKKTFIDGKIIVLLALLIRLWGISGDLPYIYHGDEPHHLNVAARFGTGDLNPHDFKYPTLWSYLLAVMLGFQYVVAKISHAVSSTHDFAVLFFQSPTRFYWAARAMSALFIALSVGVLYRTAFIYGSRGLAVVVGLLACFTPLFIEYGAEATPYGLMLFMLSAAIYALHDVITTGSKRSYILSGLFLGLATSSHFTAGVFGAWLVALHFTRKEKDHGYLALGVLMCAVGFFIGTPFALLDAKTFLGSLVGLKNSQDTATWSVPTFSASRLVDIIKNLVFYLNDWGVGFLLAIIGFAEMSREKKWEYAAWLSPLIVVLPVLALSTFGASARYVMGFFLILILLTASGFMQIWRKVPRWTRMLLSAILFLPLFWNAFQIKRYMALPDTRTITMDWLLQNLPSGEKVFITDPFYGPQPKRSRAQIERLLRRTEQLNHPRKEYFRYLLEGDQGGGYQVYYLRRTVQEAWDVPERLEPAYQAQDSIDPEREGIKSILQEGIAAVIIDEHALKRRKNSTWVQELKATPPTVEFFPSSKIKGPYLAIYLLTSKNPTAK